VLQRAGAISLPAVITVILAKRGIQVLTFLWTPDQVRGDDVPRVDMVILRQALIASSYRYRSRFHSSPWLGKGVQVEVSHCDGR